MGCSSQNRLSHVVAPPPKVPYATPAILWLLGFFVVVAFDGRGNLSWLLGMLSAGYLLLLPTYLLGALSYSLFVCPKRKREWERQFLCQRCGAVAAGD